MRRFALVSLFLAAACDQSSGRHPGNGGGGGDNNPGGCQGQACFQMDCGAGKPRTSVSGRVMAPNGIDPVYDAAVYVPYNIPEFPTTVQCEVCNEPVGG